MKTAIIYIYDFIGSDAVSANYIRNVVTQYEEQGIENFELHINSGGGSVFEGIAIYNFLKTRNVTVYVDGLAASIASVIAMAGKKIYMYKSTMMMIHNPVILTAGDSEEIKKTAGTLDQVKKAIVEAYAEKSGNKKTDIEALMDDETWMTADEAVKKGFADEVVKLKTVKNYIGVFTNVIGDENNNPNKNKGTKMNKALLAFLGLPENADEKAIMEKIAAIKKDLGLDDSASIADVIARIKDDDDEEIDDESAPEEFRDPRVDKILEETKKHNAENLVDVAITDGKIFPADRPIWLAQAIYDYDGTRKALLAKEKNSALPGNLNVNKSGEEKEDSDPVKAAANFFKEQGRAPIAVKK